MLEADIRKIYLPNGDILLSEVKFHLEAGKIYSIIGKNGTGKTTLIKSLTGLLDTNFHSVDGSVFFCGKDLLKLKEEELRLIRKNNIRYIFQDTMSGFDPLKKFSYYFEILKTDNAQLDNLLEYFQLPSRSNLKNLYPYEASGGMTQRIACVLAFLSNPSLLFLDEPTSGIDYPAANLLLLKLKEFTAAGKTAVLVTQDIDFARKLDSGIAFISDKRLSGFYTKDEIFNIKEENITSLLKSLE